MSTFNTKIRELQRKHYDDGTIQGIAETSQAACVATKCVILTPMTWTGCATYFEENIAACVGCSIGTHLATALEINAFCIHFRIRFTHLSGTSLQNKFVHDKTGLFFCHMLAHEINVLDGPFTAFVEEITKFSEFLL